MRKGIAGIILFLIFSGCTAGLKQRWVDFNAYYNTYYNAQTSYERGIRLMENQTFNINTARPIRIHRTPVRAGQADFDKAIEKSADILRNHAESKWVDDALELIGKSFFQLSQFFSAEQKFDEILTASTNTLVRQRAVLWKGRIYLETSRYNEGIRYLNGVIASEEYNWNRQILAEINLVLAQLFVMTQDWESAITALDTGLPEIRNDMLRSRGNFLYGQILERTGKLDEAYIAYGGISRKYPEYQLILAAKIKRAEINRERGNLTEAHRSLLALSRDDKYFDQVADINYELGRTLQYKGRPLEAFEIFEDVLYNSIRPPTRETIAKTHYAIAELYRFNFGDYTLAAAYYDSSSRSASDLSRLPEKFDASLMAQSFGDYARISTEINKLDSLLWLGTLPRAQFDSVLTRIRDRKLEEYQRRLRQEQLRGTTVVTVGQVEEQAESSRDSGFLNHRNVQQVQQAAQSFAAIWGERPLVDDWRRLQAVRQAAIARDDSDAISTPTPGGTLTPEGRPTITIPAELDIDLTVIPFTEADQNKTRENIAALEYQLGNVFYLSLDMPDSALTHYKRVVNDFPKSDVRPQAMYTITDIYIASNNIDESNNWANKLVQTYPSSIMAQRIASRLNMDVQLEGEIISDEEIAKRDYIQMLNAISDESPEVRLSMYDEFMQAHPNASQKPDVLLNQAIAWAEIARNKPEFSRKLSSLSRAKSDWEVKQQKFAKLQSEAKEALSDTTLSEDIRAKYSSIVDSTLSPPNLDNYFPYIGSAWDSSRVALTSLVSSYPRYNHIERARAMSETLKIPASFTREEDDYPDDTQPEESATPDIPEDYVPESVECDVIDSPFAIAGGLNTFLETSGFKDILGEQGILMAEFEYQITVGPKGEVENVRTLTRNDPLNLAAGLRSMLLNNAQFVPPTSNGYPVRTACYFPVLIELE